MNNYKIIEFDTVLNMLAENALSKEAKEKILNIGIFLNKDECIFAIKETSFARKILEKFGAPPLATMDNIAEITDICEKQGMLTAEQLSDIANFINTCRRTKGFMQRISDGENSVAHYGNSISSLNTLQNELDDKIRNKQVSSTATNKLANITKQIDSTKQNIQGKLDSILRSKKTCFSENFILQRNNRFVLPTKKECKNQISGTVVEISGTGNTYFIEPSQVSKYNEQLNILEIEKENEIITILYTLTDLVAEHLKEIKINKECMEILDFIFAKAKFSLDTNSTEPIMNLDTRILIKEGRHPLLDKNNCVPLDFDMDKDTKGVIITGPNTGGKTVTLKTVGLLLVMAQSGLHVPAKEGSSFCMRSNILCDIGDGQSISQNLSTFSSHIKNIIAILENTTSESLVLLDEPGSGTDPTEGMGIAVAILEELRRKNCMFLATSHYPEIKEYALKTPKIINAKMEFDRNTLKPLYNLQIGESGESCAIYIAQKLGFPKHMLEIADKVAYSNDKDIFDNFKDNSYEKEKNFVSLIKENNLVKKNKNDDNCKKFQMGDSVVVSPTGEMGIVYSLANEKGDYTVQIKKEKILVNHKRITLIVSREELYPEDYDFSIIFDSKDNRKARHIMDRRYDANVVITE